jgi:phospholipase C
LALFGVGLLSVLTACGGGGEATGGIGPPPGTPTPAGGHLPSNVIVVVQENRSVDNLFHTLPGIDTVDAGLNSKNQPVPLEAMPLQSSFDPTHTHRSFAVEYNGGLMNGFDAEKITCGMPPTNCVPATNVYKYVQASDIQNYLQLAEEFGFADHVFQANQGPSYPAHFYLVAAQSGRPMAVAENASNLEGGCDAPAGTTLQFVDLRTSYPGFPLKRENGACVDFPTIFDELDAAHVSWRYYAPEQDSLWNAPNGIRHMYQSPEFKTNVVYPESTVLHDIAAGTLARVSYVVPAKIYSDHPQLAGANGPNWVGTVANAVGRSKYWNQTVILVVWDDWGGWYDHYAPHAPVGLPNDPYELGMRVPLIAISPYIRQRGLIDHTPRNFTSILRFIETIYGLHALTEIDSSTDDLMTMFNFNAAQPFSYMPVDTHGFVPDSAGRRARLAGKPQPVEQSRGDVLIND